MQLEGFAAEQKDAHRGRMEGFPVQDLSADVLAALRNTRFGFVFQQFLGAAGRGLRCASSAEGGPLESAGGAALRVSVHLPSRYRRAMRLR